MVNIMQKIFEGGQKPCTTPVRPYNSIKSHTVYPTNEKKIFKNSVAIRHCIENKKTTKKKIRP